jgi:hypothetical protein
MCQEEPTRVFLVYQAGIANVFRVSSFNLADFGRDAERLMQGDFYGCVQFARGMGAMGAIVRTAACNKSGDILWECWNEDFEDMPFADKIRVLEIN